MMFKNVFDGAKVRTFFQLFSVFPVKLTKSGEQHHDIFLLNHSFFTIHDIQSLLRRLPIELAPIERVPGIVFNFFNFLELRRKMDEKVQIWGVLLLLMRIVF